VWPCREKEEREERSSHESLVKNESKMKILSFIFTFYLAEIKSRKVKNIKLKLRLN